MKQSQSCSDPRCGFALFEIAITIAVIGLIVGGIMVGTSLIRSAQMQTLIGQVDQYTKAIKLFKDKYNELPGDMPTAQTLWGVDAGCPSGNYSAAGSVPKTATCNGNGDGIIGGGNGGANDYEVLRAWQHLANAGFIPGIYSGISGNPANTQPVFIAWGLNTPNSALQGCGLVLMNFPMYRANVAGGDTSAWKNDISQAALVVTTTVAGPASDWPPCITTADAYGIDSKIDDGLPYSGKVMDGQPVYTAVSGAYYINATTAAAHNACTAAGMVTANQYSTTTTGNVCGPAFSLGL